MAVVGLGASAWRAEPTPAAGPTTVVVEDWSGQPIGHIGIPLGWERQRWSQPKCDLRVEETAEAVGARRVLHLLSANDNCTISKRVEKIDIREYPILRWRWRAVTLPEGGDSRRAETDDQAAQIYLVFPRFPAAARSRIIGYVWDSTAPVGGIFRSASTSLVTYVIVRSGPRDLGTWITESRNVRDDFKRIFGEEPSESLEVVSIGIDSNDTHSRAESYVGELLFSRS